MSRERSVRNLVLLMQGQFVSNLGNQVFDIAMLLWIKELTGSAAIMGLAMLLTGLPEALLAPFGGSIADRYGRLRVIILSDLVSAMAVGGVLIVVLIQPEPAVAIAALCLGNIALGLSASCFTPAVAALIPSLVVPAQLEKGNAAHQFSRVGGKIVGQGLGGLLFAMLGVGGAFAVNALSFLLSANSEYWIKMPQRQPQPIHQDNKSLIKNTLAMLGRVWQQPNMRSLLLLIAAFHLCLSCLPILLPYYAEHILGIADTWFGLFIAIYTAGIMFGFIIAGALQPPKNRFGRIALVSGAVGLLFALLGAVSSAPVAATCLLGIGVGIGVVIVNLMTELQLAAPEGERGGVMGAAKAIGDSSLPLGMAMTGLLHDGALQLGASHGEAVRSILAIAAAIALAAAVGAAAALRRKQAPG
jgi:MFS transporter, DHA3 family, macrolide efflux protein